MNEETRKMKPFASKLGCFVARSLVQKFSCERIVDLAGLLEVKIDYRSESGFYSNGDQTTISRYLPGMSAVRIFGDQIFEYQEKLEERDIHIKYNHLVYHAVACGIGHHLWYKFLKQYPDQQIPNRFAQLWDEFERWLQESVRPNLSKQ